MQLALTAMRPVSTRQRCRRRSGALGHPPCQPLTTTSRSQYAASWQEQREVDLRLLDGGLPRTPPYHLEVDTPVGQRAVLSVNGKTLGRRDRSDERAPHLPTPP